jgi:hypothetical protein
MYPSNLTPIEIRQILFKANRLSMSLHLEKKKIFESIKYAVRAFWLLPSPQLGMEMVREYYRYLVMSVYLIGKKQKLSSTAANRSIHWSSVGNKVVIKNSIISSQ